MKTVLTLDTALRTGWAKLARDGSFTTGVFDLGRRRGQTNGLRFDSFRGWLRQIMEGVDLVVYEAPITHGRGGDQVKLALGFVALLELEAAVRGAELLPVPGATLKKSITGRGDSLKPAMIGWALGRWGWDERWLLVRVEDAPRPHREALAKIARRGRVPDDNQVDAVLLMHHALRNVLFAQPGDYAPSGPSATLTPAMLAPVFDGELAPCEACEKGVERISANCLWTQAPKEPKKWTFIHPRCLERRQRKAGQKSRREAKRAKKVETPTAVEELVATAGASKRRRSQPPEDPGQMALF